MLLQLRLGDDRYALDAQWVVEVVPRVVLKHLPHAPCGVAGAMNYRGSPVPVIDFSRLAGGPGAASALSTRIVVLRCPAARGQEPGLVGLMLEGATKLLRSDDVVFLPGPAAGDAPYLGRLASDAHGLLQEIRPEGLAAAGLRRGCVSPDDAPAEAVTV